PNPMNPPSGCRFHTRCPIAADRCVHEDPPMVGRGPEHRAACWER
ncbi:peptide ABC transporter substrate-binding protein, partial [Enterococcus hirae]